jgi:hypothetical protein
MRVIFKVFFILLILTSFAPSVYAQQKSNPVIWKTAYNEFSSSNFYIQIGDQKFYGIEPVSIHSDPGLERSTMELSWKENGISQRLFLYFQKTTNNLWEIYDLRSYNSTGTDWIYYSPLDINQQKIGGIVGQRFFQKELVLTSNDGSAKIYCQDCSITAFITISPPVSTYGYSVDFRIGIPQNETITINTDPMTGYGVNAVLLDRSGNIVKDQSSFLYRWHPENPTLIALQAGTVPYPDGNCAYGVLAPCPEFNLQIRGLQPGVTRIILDIIRKSDEVVVASNAFNIKVIDKPTLVTPTPIVTQKLQPTSTEIISQLQELKGEVGRLNQTVSKQQEDINLLQKIINSLQGFFQKIFGYKSE